MSLKVVMMGFAALVGYRPGETSSRRGQLFPWHQVLRTLLPAFLLGLPALAPAASLTMGDAVDAPSLPWVSFGQAQWQAQTNVTHDGIHALQTGVLGDGESSAVQVAARGPGTVAFWWKVSCEPTYDSLRFLVDGAMVYSISGNANWQRPFYTLSPGVHVLTWEYRKDYSISLNQDAGWLDEVKLITGTLSEAVNNTNLTWTTGGEATWLVRTNSTHDGVMSAASGTLTHGQHSWMETQVTGPGMLSFWWRVSSETNWDFLRLTTNGGLAAQISGETAWQQHLLPIPSGTQTVAWEYVKDLSATEGLDMGWVDEVNYTYQPGPLVLNQPQAQYVLGGSRVTMEYHVLGEQPMQYQWLRQSTGATSHVPVTSANLAQLVFASVRRADAGTYVLVASNAFGSVTSAPVFLSVQSFKIGSPAVSNRLFQFDIQGEDQTVFHVQATSNLVDWSPLFTVSNLAAGLRITDTNAPTRPRRFYRVVEQPGSN